MGFSTVCFINLRTLVLVLFLTIAALSFHPPRLLLSCCPALPRAGLGNNSEPNLSAAFLTCRALPTLLCWEASSASTYLRANGHVASSPALLQAFWQGEG